MKDMYEIDKNFKAPNPEKSDAKFYNISEKPFRIYGIYKPENDVEYIRMPRSVAKATSVEAVELNAKTAGGRVRFKTNSKYIIVRCVTSEQVRFADVPLTGTCGFDIYADGSYAGTIKPPDKIENVFDGIVELGDGKMRDIIINFPYYNSVRDVFLGLDKSAEVSEGNLYKHQTPIVFYGSSITQGGCASRPGNTYINVLSRRLDFDFINLGLSGNAKGEDSMAEYIAGLEMSAFVYDYDHNAPNWEHLRNTHYKMYKKIRDKNPDIPIIMASRPRPYNTVDWRERIGVIEDTMKKAHENGDNNVYFVNGLDIFNSHDGDMMTVDGTHPNDFGFYCMAEAFERVLRKFFD